MVTTATKKNTQNAEEFARKLSADGVRGGCPRLRFARLSDSGTTLKAIFQHDRRRDITAQPYYSGSSVRSDLFIAATL
jgi:hypothetical protein